MERSNHVFMAKVAEKSQRYEDMVEHMKKVAELNVELTVEERNMLLSGYKHVVGAKRASWRILTSVEQMDEAKGEERNVKVIRAYKHKIETELSKVCGDALPILDQHLIPSSTTEESLVFYHKMKGDYYRYLAEFKTGNELKEAADKALEAYQMASNTATAELPSTHPIRLGLFMNLSVFYYEILKSPKRACDLAKLAHDEAAAELHTLSEESSKDSSILLQFLKDNISVWSSDIQDETGEDQNKAGEVKI